MELKELVPPLELCRLIPKGEFEDSALMWFSNYHFGGWHVEKRELAIAFTDNGELYPAPTLEEIMATMQFCRVYKKSQGFFIAVKEKDREVSRNGATAALKLWLKLKEINAQKTSNFEQ